MQRLDWNGRIVESDRTGPLKSMVSHGLVDSVVNSVVGSAVKSVVEMVVDFVSGLVVESEFSGFSRTTSEQD